MSLTDCRIVSLPRIASEKGNLTFIESKRHIPFDIKRIYYLYDVPGGGERGEHAHKKLEQLMVAMSGSFDVVLEDGRKSKRFHLNRAYHGLYIPPMTWRRLDNFSSGAVCLVLASDFYKVEDYIRDRQVFLKIVGRKKTGGEKGKTLRGDRRT